MQDNVEKIVQYTWHIVILTENNIDSTTRTIFISNNEDQGSPTEN